MKIFRALLIWILALSLPIEGMATSSMAHCAEMKLAKPSVSAVARGPHDHAAMMAMGAMANDPSMAEMNHAQHVVSAQKAGNTAKASCECGCKCSGDCAVACSGMMVSLAQFGFSMDVNAASAVMMMPRGQAHAAYRYDPLRPPSAVAL